MAKETDVLKKKAKVWALKSYLLSFQICSLAQDKDVLINRTLGCSWDQVSSIQLTPKG